jgi:uncharacterized protein (TIGR02147 family)
MTSIFDYTDYRAYIRNWIEGLGAQAHGAKGRIAQALGVSSSLISQILKAEKTLTPDQASDLADHFGLNEIESDYIQLLVDLDRAASPRLRRKLERKIAHIQGQAKQIGKRVPRQMELTDEQRAIYYSSWLYTGIRNLTAVPTINHVSAIARHLHLEPTVVSRILGFLIENGLCREVDGSVTYGPSSTHVDFDSPFVNKHHQNWRIKAIQQMENKQEGDVFFTSPMSLSKVAAQQVRKLLPNFIQEVMKVTGPSQSEKVACLNIDWFSY